MVTASAASSLEHEEGGAVDLRKGVAAGLSGALKTGAGTWMILEVLKEADD